MKVFVAFGLIASIIIAVMGLAFEALPEYSNGLYTLAGLGLLTFGIWAAVLLLRREVK